jgi:predicted nucleic acid-binding protein
VPKYTLDTNVLIDALREPAELAALKAFLERTLPICYLSGVVVQELEAGVTTRAQAILIADQIVGPFARRGRVIPPSTDAWVWSGQILWELRRGQRGPLPASLANDTLLACSCREAGLTLVTRDTDFRRLVRHVSGLRVVAPYPQPPLRRGA